MTAFESRNPSEMGSIPGCPLLFPSPWWPAAVWHISACPCVLEVIRSVLAGTWSSRLRLLIATAHYGCRVVSMPAGDITKAKTATLVCRSFAHGEVAAIFIKIGCGLQIAEGVEGKGTAGELWERGAAVGILSCLSHTHLHTGPT